MVGFHPALLPKLLPLAQLSSCFPFQLTCECLRQALPLQSPVEQELSYSSHGAVSLLWESPEKWHFYNVSQERNFNHIFRSRSTAIARVPVTGVTPAAWWTCLEAALAARCRWGKAPGKVAFPGHSLLTLAPLLLARASQLLCPAPVPLAALDVQPVLSQAPVSPRLNEYSRFSWYPSYSR